MLGGENGIVSFDILQRKQWKWGQQHESICFDGSVWANDRSAINSAYAIDLL